MVLRKPVRKLKLRFVSSSPQSCLWTNRYSRSLFCKMDDTESDEGDVSSAKAVLLGALAPGVNGPTWITLKSAFLLLGLCLLVMLGLAFSSSDSSLMLHVALLVLICVSLFLLLSWFLAETGLVSVEHQMREMGLAQSDHLETSKKNK